MTKEIISYFWLIGSILGLLYTFMTTPKKDFKEMDNIVIVFITLLLIATSWWGLVVSIAADIVAIKKKIND